MTARATPVVLCVDDEPMVLDSLREQFERLLQGEYEIEIAQDAAEALEIVDELSSAGVPIPVVISDHIMPGMKGDEFLVRLHARLPETRTILLTGQAGLDAVGRAVNEAGLYRYIVKPWQREDLALTVRGAIQAFETDAKVRAQQSAALRFVPYEFMNRLGRTDLTEVRRGDHVHESMSVYYSDVRSYTTLVLGRSPAENLEWINDYLQAMEEPIRRHGGFVESVAGDAVIALFRGADQIVQAGIASLRSLVDHNQVRASRSDPPLQIGIGITTGEVLLGVLGGADRLKCGVVGDPVNLAARIEGLTRHLGTMIISGQTYAALEDPERYALRYVDRVRVKGRDVPTDLYEVLDGLDTQARDRKLALRETLREAIQRFVPVHDLGLGDDGELYFTMKLVEGRSLAQWIAARTDNELPPWDELLDQLDVAIKVCDALAFAHAKGVIHCDIKPANVMVGDHGQVYLMDWGIARLLEDERARAAAGEANERVAVGTPGYMPREQVLGLPLDARSDVFAVGALLYCLVCGRPPYGDRTDVLVATVFESPTSPSELRPVVSPALARIILKALAPEPSDRYASVHALKMDLVRFVRGGEAFEEITHEGGSTVVCEGEPGDTAFIIQSGRCEVTIRGTHVRQMGPGEVFGEMAILSSGTRTATVRALERTVLRRIDGARFREELDAMKPWMGALMRALAARVGERR